MHELPPSYTIAIEDTGGVLNQSFINNEETPASSENEAESSNSQSRESDIKTINRTSDSVLHI